MKSFFFMALVGFVVVLVLVQAFKANFEQQIENRVQMSIASSTLSAPAPQNPATPPSETNNYQGFHGPIGKPYIIGPSGPPPGS